MNIYNLHTNPEQLKYYNDDKTKIPYFALKKAMRMKQHPGNDLTDLEHTIAKEAEPSLTYANKVIRGRFPEGEPAILSAGIAESLRYFGRQFDYEVHWPELAEIILQNGTPRQARNYAENMTTRWPEAEELIKQDKGEWRIYQNWMQHI